MAGLEIFPNDEHEGDGGKSFSRKAGGVVTIKREKIDADASEIYGRHCSVNDAKRYHPCCKFEPGVEDGARDKDENDGEWK